ncbi:TetR family transcriptional regulator [Bradyrhizobium sp. LHD-71]|uniref:TetR family transcriptional regulator n=1 Tax=Bradyrhizobium sp. LHD-71 TaxID=3072141 RepID=UPI0028101A8D|nr:TetR family transcriptional regulator [Bradyrhizobium sp. LHD-71]MDQ8732279.1 TetR family transcriptional regulator [Bradyrhizobium sp. LHD-71]
MRTDTALATQKAPQQQNVTAAKLLKAAGELMIERNSIDISLSELAKKSGVNAALVKYHFGNKDGLLLALLTRDSQSEIANLDYLMRQPISPTEKLKLHIAGIIKAYHRFPYLNRLIHRLLYESNEKAAKEVSHVFARPVFEFQRRLLEEGVEAGEFRKVDPMLFYISLIGACDHLFHGRTAMSPALGLGGVTDDVRRRYVAHMTELICGGILRAPAVKSGKTSKYK